LTDYCAEVLNVQDRGARYLFHDPPDPMRSSCVKGCRTHQAEPCGNRSPPPRSETAMRVHYVPPDAAKCHRFSIALLYGQSGVVVVCDYNAHSARGGSADQTRSRNRAAMDQVRSPQGDQDWHSTHD